MYIHICIYKYRDLLQRRRSRSWTRIDERGSERGYKNMYIHTHTHFAKMQGSFVDVTTTERESRCETTSTAARVDIKHIHTHMCIYIDMANVRRCRAHLRMCPTYIYIHMCVFMYSYINSRCCAHGLASTLTLTSKIARV